MSFFSRPLGLTGAAINTHPLQHCTRHKGQAEPGGGIELGGKWICARCWSKVRQVKPSTRKETS